MPFELKLALKYFRARRNTLARFTSLAAIIGITAGVASLILSNALARGFSDEMQDKILANTAHISIFTNDGSEIIDWQEIKKNLESLENIREVTATTYENAIIIGKDSTSYAILRVMQAQNPQNSISVGAKLAEKLNIQVGDVAEIIALGNQSEPKRTRILVNNIFQTGLYEYDVSWIYITPEYFAKLSEKRDFTPTILSVSVMDIYQADQSADEVRTSLGENFRVIDWQEANQPLFAALSLERKVVLAIISLIIFIAALNITTTLALLVNERRLDIAILRTCGAKTRSLVSIFLIEGLLLGLLGIFSGVVLGLTGCFLGNYFKLIKLSAEVYALELIPFHSHPTNTLFIILIAFTVCLTATVFPAFKASRIKPLENLRAQ